MPLGNRLDHVNDLKAALHWIDRQEETHGGLPSRWGPASGSYDPTVSTWDAKRHSGRWRLALLFRHYHSVLMNVILSQNWTAFALDQSLLFIQNKNSTIDTILNTW
jgi:hypothetical protein